MRWILGVALLVGAVWFLISRQDSMPAPEAPASAAPVVKTPQQALPSAPPAAEPVIAAEPVATAPEEAAPERDDDGVINIGEPMDPDDPSTWPRDGR